MVESQWGRSGSEGLPEDVVIRTPDRRLRVFVSSTLGELAAERQAVSRAISALRLTRCCSRWGPRCCPTRGRNATSGWPRRAFVHPAAAACFPQPRNWTGPGAPGRPGGISGARSASGLVTPITRSGPADDHPMRRRTPGPFRKLEAVALLTGPLVPAPQPGRRAPCRP